MFRLTDSPPTRATLLLRLRDADDTDAWSQFVGDYGPMLYRFVRRCGLQDADAADLVQDVMRAVGGAISRLDYQKEKGGFRAWLFTITRNKLYTFLEKNARTEKGGGDTAAWNRLGNHEDSRDELNQQWELEHQRQVAAQAMQVIRDAAEPKTWSAFQMTAIDGRSASDVGKELGLSTGSVYVARSRITAKLRDEVQRVLLERDT
ncbi:MAG: sigma-70 family RNA polymerase sigma factor [Planctomycetota bacterium]